MQELPICKPEEVKSSEVHCFVAGKAIMSDKTILTTSAGAPITNNRPVATDLSGLL